MGATGLSHSLQVSKNGLLKTSLAVMSQKISFVDDTLNTQKVPSMVNNELYKNDRVSFTISYNTKIGSTLNWKTGAFASRIGYTFRQSLYDFDAARYQDNIVDGTGNTWLWQPYTQLNWKPGKHFTINAGLHYMYLALNKTSSLEPRAGIQFKINAHHTLSFATGLYGKTLPLGAYFYKTPNGSLPNLDLDIMRSAHYIAGYDWLMKKNWHLHVEAYLQKLSRVPVVNDVNRTFWLLNMIEGYANEALVSKGKGQNVGTDITLEKFFSKSWFMLIGFSVFNSTYQPLNGNTYNTQYNSHTAGSFTTGKEWKWKHNKTFAAGGKMLYNGSMPISPLLEGAAVNSRKPVLDCPVRLPAILRCCMNRVPSIILPGFSLIGFRKELNGLYSLCYLARAFFYLLVEKKRLEGLWPADYFFRRQLWLMLFSLFDVFILLWFGDILLDYACLGMIMFAFRRLPPKALIMGAAVCFLLSFARENRDFYQDKKTIRKGELVAAMDTTKIKLTDQQKENLGAMTDFKENSTQEKKVKRMERSIRKMTGSYEELYEYRSSQYVNSLVGYLYFGSWDVLLFMFLGMAFFKMGILTGQASVKVYWWMFIMGLGVGLTISYFRIHQMIDNKFNWFNYTKNNFIVLYEPSRTFRAIGIFGLIMLLYKSGWFKWLFALMRPVGQMAFTNYLMQSLMCGLFFLGGGLFVWAAAGGKKIFSWGCLGGPFILSDHWLKFFVLCVSVDEGVLLLGEAPSGS